MSEKIALIDMDGTICDYSGAMNTKLRELAHPDEEDPLHGGPHIKARRSLIKKQPGFWRGLKRIPAGFRVVNMMRRVGFDLNILTKGPDKSTNAWTEKVEWCQEHIPEATIHISQDKGLVYGRVLFDDFPPYVMRWLEWRPRGQVIMLEHEWNKDFEHPNVFKYKNTFPDGVYDEASESYFAQLEQEQRDKLLKVLTAAYERP